MDQILNIPDGQKTTYTINDEHRERSSITIDKWAADLLQEMMQDKVHEWVQAKFDLVCQKHPKLSRREKGDLVRRVANATAEKSPYCQKITDLF